MNRNILKSTKSMGIVLSSALILGGISSYSVYANVADNLPISKQILKEVNWAEVKSVPEISKVELGDFYTSINKYRIQFKLPLFDKTMNLYRNNITSIKVNNLVYSNCDELTEDNQYRFSSIGLELSVNAFNKENNEVIISSQGFNDAKIIINKQGQLIEQKELISPLANTISMDINNKISEKEKENIDNTSANSKNSSDDLFSSEDEVKIKTLPKVTNSRYGEIYGRAEYEISLEQNDRLDDYIRSVSELTVNGVKHKDNFNFSTNEYHLSYMGGLELNDHSFTKEVNTIIMKSKKYNTMVIKIKKDGTLVSQQEFKSEKNKENTPPMLTINKSITVEKGNKINLMENVKAIDEEDGIITDKVKIDYGTLDINNPKKGIYKVIYSVTDSKGKTVTDTCEVNVIGKLISTENLEDGTYTLNFKARRIDKPENSSMLEDFFNKNVKMDVKNGKIKLTMLNTMYAYSLYDFRIESNNVFNETVAKNYGTPNKDGEYEMQTFEVPIENLNDEHIGGVLVGMMGGKKTEIGDMSKYTKVKFIFDKECTKGWDGFVIKKEEKDSELNLINALKKNGLDTNKDGKISKEELANAKGVIDLSNQGIENITMLSDLGPNVTELYLNGNNIEILPKGIFNNLTGLKKLSLAGNTLHAIPSDIFGKLTNLENLNLNSNKLKIVSKDSLSNLKKLKHLGLSKNQLTRIEDNSFDDLVCLNELFLSNNKLTEFPTSIGKLNSLNTLYADNNKIEKLPKEFSLLKNLTNITLQNNRISEISTEIYKNLTNVKEFNLSDNQLKNIPENLLEIMPNLKDLNVSLNKLQFLPKLSVDKYISIPQKDILNLKLTSYNNTLKWTQDFSILDLYCWTIIIDKYSTKGNIPNNFKEYKNALNNKTAKEFLKGKIDWKITTELQRKKANGEYETLKEFSEEINEDVLTGDFSDISIKSGEEYRIIKTISSIGSGETRSFSEISNYIVPKIDNISDVNNKDEQENNQNKPKESEDKPSENSKEDSLKIKNGLYSLLIKTLKEGSDEPSMAGGYIENTNYEVKDGKQYLLLKLNRIDWMKNIVATVDGDTITPTIVKTIKNDKGEEKGIIKFEVNSPKSQIKLTMNVEPMGNPRVSFKIIPEIDSLTLIKENDIKDSEQKPDEKPLDQENQVKPNGNTSTNEEQEKQKEDFTQNKDNKHNNSDEKDKDIKMQKVSEKILKVVENKNLKTGIYENVKAMLSSENKKQEQLIKENLIIKTNATITKEKEIVVQMELTGKYALNSKIFVDGKEILVKEVTKDRKKIMSSGENHDVKQDIQNKKIVEFKLPNINSKIELAVEKLDQANNDIKATINLKDDLVSKSLDKNTLPKELIKETLSNKKNETKEDKNTNTENNKEVLNEDKEKKLSKGNKQESGEKSDLKTTTSEKSNNNAKSRKNNEDLSKKRHSLASIDEVEQTVQNEDKTNKISIQKSLPKTGLPINTEILAGLGAILSGVGVAFKKRFKK